MGVTLVPDESVILQDTAKVALSTSDEYIKGKLTLTNKRLLFEYKEKPKAVGIELLRKMFFEGSKEQALGLWVTGQLFIDRLEVKGLMWGKHIAFKTNRGEWKISVSDAERWVSEIQTAAGLTGRTT